MFCLKGGSSLASGFPAKKSELGYKAGRLCWRASIQQKISKIVRSRTMYVTAEENMSFTAKSQPGNRLPWEMT